MAEAELSVRRIAAKHRIDTPLSIRRDILSHGRFNMSLREKLAQMQLPFVGDVKYCNPRRLDEFDVHFVVIAPTHDSAGNSYFDSSIPPRPLSDFIPTADNAIDDPVRGSLSGEAVFRREVEILNEYFVMQNEDGVRNPVSKRGFEIRFRYKSHHYLEDIQQTGDALLEYGRQEDWQNLCQEEYPKYYGAASGCWIDDIWACNDRRLYDPLAINVYVFDNMKPDCTNQTVDPFDKQSYGNSNKRGRRYRPYILMDWVRMFHRDYVEEHEMGHVFGLNHVCNQNVGDPGDVSEHRPLHSNIMQGSGCKCKEDDPPSENGLRDLGFGVVMHEENHCEEEYDQVRKIVKTALKLQRSWGEVYRSRWPGPL